MMLALLLLLPVSQAHAAAVCDCASEPTYSGSYKQWVMYKFGSRIDSGSSTEFGGSTDDRVVQQACRAKVVSKPECYRDEGRYQSCECVAESTYSGSYQQWVMYKFGSRVDSGSSTQFDGHADEWLVTRDCRNKIVAQPSCFETGGRQKVCECVAEPTYSGSYKQWVMYKLGQRFDSGSSTEFSGSADDRVVTRACYRKIPATPGCYE